MGKTNDVNFHVLKNILDLNNLQRSEDEIIIPLIKTENNQNTYDELYSSLGEKAGFLFDITYSQLYLNISLNLIQQFELSISANYFEFRIENVPLSILGKYNNQTPICLSNEELDDIYPILLKLFKLGGVEIL